MTKVKVPTCEECGEQLLTIEFKTEGSLEFNFETGKYENPARDLTLYCEECGCSTTIPDDSMIPEEL